MRSGLRIKYFPEHVAPSDRRGSNSRGSRCEPLIVGDRSAISDTRSLTDRGAISDNPTKT